MGRRALPLATGVAVLAFLLSFSTAPARASTVPGVRYVPPVDAPVSDTFRPPPAPWLAGNRGIDYATAAGTEVHAAADGVVTFAGQVGGTLHVVVLHADGVRTSYSFLASIRVHAGDRVVQGQVVGTSGTDLHFGARIGDRYIDPAQLFATGPADVYLVPDRAPPDASEQAERGGLLQGLAGLAGRFAGGARAATGSSAAALGWARGQATGAAVSALGAVRQQLDSRLGTLRTALHELNPLRLDRQVLAAVQVACAWWRQRGHCTPPATPAPRLTARHLAVLVGGLGSSSGHAAILGLHTSQLGYAPADVVQFSYRGGTADADPYRPADTTVDIRQSGRRLRDLLVRLGQEHPGVPVDLLAHSQGGLVVRTALGDEIDAGDPRLPPLGAVVTLGSPHRGADLATALALVGGAPAGAAAETALHAALPGQVDPRSPSVRQMAETSTFLARLNQRPLPAGVRFTSIGAREDLVVPLERTRLPGATNVTVAVPGLVHDHDRLPSSPAAQREVALALVGMPPTCRGLVDAVADAVVGHAVDRTEIAAGVALGLAAHALDPVTPLAPTGAGR